MLDKRKEDIVEERKGEEGQEFPGIWTIQSYPLAYRTLPKCACSTVGQVMHYIESEQFYPGVIHDDRLTLKKWGHAENAPAVAEVFRQSGLVSFTVTRNPYRRILSAFADKMFGYQARGGRYRGGVLHAAAESFDVRFDGKSNIFDVFNGFVKFVAASIKERTNTDIHFSATTHHLRYNIAKCPTWPLHYLGYVEHLSDDLDNILRMASIDPTRIPRNIPKENATSIGFTCEQMYRPETEEIVRHIYADDFQVFGYSFDIGQAAPFEKRNAADVYDRLAAIHKKKGLRP